MLLLISLDGLVAINSDDVKAVNDILVPGETVVLTATQRRFMPGGSMITPTTIVCTEKRIIILNRASLGLRRDYESIGYKQITSVRFEKGVVNGSVYIRIQGYDKDKGLLKNGEQEGEINGLKVEEAKEMSDYIGKKLVEIEDAATNQMPADPQPAAPKPPANTLGAGVYCSKCGAKNPISANFCESCGKPLKGK
jgi:hypothetical protein